ncbi:MAG TPA: TfoX/Sxy family protein [Devosia sp.]|nr:TfoX/Sxy family protein [Devosia sp.]
MSTSETMDYLAERVRALVGHKPGITEKTMFGGLTFLLNGHILVGCKKDGRILLSVGKENSAAALARPGATPMVHNSRAMTGFVWVDADAIEDDDELLGWVRFAENAVGAKPPKDVAPARKSPAGKAPAAKSRKTRATR